MGHSRFKALIAALIVVMAAFGAGAKVKVACIGNSITYGYKLPEPARDSYPSQLQRMLGDGYEVGNFGHSGATLLRNGHRPYNTLPEFRQALEFSPDIAVIHLGINDTDPRDWPAHNDEFIADYLAIIDSLRAVNPEVRVIVAELTPLRATHFRFPTGTRDWRIKIQQAIRNVAAAAGAELIDFDSPLRDRQNLIFDGIHPDTEGAGILAETVRGAITGNYGGLSLPAIYGDGMILQRNRPLTFSGRADAGSRIALTLDNRTYHTTANNRGEWAVTTGPLVTGPTYTLTVTDGKSTLRFTDILAGEVWLASGQSNMEFPLGVTPEPDSLLRVYDMKPVARTDNVVWPDSVVAEMDALRHFRPARWSAPDATFSAVAWHFARQLRDSLGVPVGVISNAVGGSPAESWVDINTLEARMHGILLNPRGNDYLQKWVQERMARNLGDRPSSRHPYEPSYLFAAGIRPLRAYPVAGVIWYQGESNAHNIELHEELFTMLVDSWRREFGNPRLPFYFVQLSSLSRPTWAEFRNSQRLLAERIEGVGMAVSHDHGDSLDVHPRNKRPIGDRLARLALHRTYGRDVEDSGPTLSSATLLPDGRMLLSFDHSEGLTTSDGLAPRVFEVAELDGLFYPAEARITDNNTIILSSMDVKKPRFVRYAWQPFTRSNLVNSAGLPASTFKAEADNAADLDPEPGYERGVSAAFCGMLDGMLIVAGGANFPCPDPLAPDARKVLYKGIYAARPDSLQWRRIGSLPEPMAYGTSATTERGLVLTCGRRAMLLTSAGAVEELPAPPVEIDNAYAAAIGRKVYVCGGNNDGAPSRNLYELDLDKGSWRKLRAMPGNPRVQPVMAASAGKLYVWGGFAGKHNGKDATLETSGLLYDPATDKWSPLPAPTDAEGNEISTAGACAVTLADGRIAVAGGVNKDIFLAALQNQAPDYLMHPVDWYRFNPHVLLFDPAEGSWSIAATTAEAARAGAAGIAGTDGAFYVYGGELKPRIRTAETLRIDLLPR